LIDEQGNNIGCVVMTLGAAWGMAAAAGEFQRQQRWYGGVVCLKVQVQA
jgi:hypothetical protein